jgi:hypothetical protein
VTAVLCSASCGGTSAGGGTTLAINPACTILCIVGDQTLSVWNGRAFVSEETAPDFALFRPMSPPLGNPAIRVNTTGVPDTYGVSEVWRRFPGSPVVFRSQATPENRVASDGTHDAFGSSWVIQAQDATGAWSGVFGSGTANNGTEADSPEIGALYTPQLMTVASRTPRCSRAPALRRRTAEHAPPGCSKRPPQIRLGA